MVKQKLTATMTALKQIISKANKVFVRIDPHFILLLLVIMFVVLLFAAENVVKLTIMAQ
jgi:hypothetical protein